MSDLPRNGVLAAPVILPAEAPREQWEAMRRAGIGGSDVAAACGLSPWETPYQLWLDKTGRVEPVFDDASTERMRWGSKLEPVLAAEFDERNADLVLTGGAGIYADTEYPWMLANVDGLLWTFGGELAGVLECKTGSHRGASTWDDDGVPAHYVAQVQWYMRITGALRAYVVALLDTNRYLERVVERDEELIADLIDTAREFWRHVEKDAPPPVDASEGTRRALSRLPAEPDYPIDLDPLWSKKIDRRRELDDQIRALSEERTRIDSELRAEMEAAEVAYLDGEKVATHKQPSKPSRSVNYDRLAGTYPDAYAECVTEKPAGRRLTYTTIARG